MSINIKNLVDLSKERRQEFLLQKNTEAFEKALNKIEKALEKYDPSKATLKVDISELIGAENAELCKQLVKHLKTCGVECEYKYEAGWSDDYESSPSSYLIVFNF